MGFFSDACETKLGCNVPLYAGKWNVWLLVRDMTDNPSAEQIREEVRRLMGRNLVQRAGLHVSDWLPGSDATDLAIHTFLGHSPDPEDLTDHTALTKAEWALAEEFLGTSSVVLSRDLARCQVTEGPQPSLRGKRYTRILIQFVWRGDALETDWKGARRLGYALGPNDAGTVWMHCLNETDYLLAEVWTPLEAKQVPENASDTWNGQLSNKIAKLKTAALAASGAALKGAAVVQVVGVALGVVGLGVVAKLYAGSRGW